VSIAPRRSHLGSDSSAALTALVVLVSLLAPSPVHATVTTEIFGSGFETGDFTGWGATSTGGGNLSVQGAAALHGTTFGLQALVNDTTGLYVEDDTPDNENYYYARFYFDTKDFDPGEAQFHFRARLFIGFEELPLRRLFAVVLRRQAGQYSIMARARRDDDTQADTGFVPIAGGTHLVEVAWRRASAVGANDGRLQLNLDGLVAGQVTGVDNDRSQVDFVRLGALSVKTGASGTLDFDEFDSARTSPLPFRVTNVFTILMSNHDYGDVVGSADAPYINSLIASYGLATNYMDSLTHPALPNALYLISGDTQYPGFIELNPTSFPYFPADGDNLGNQLQTAGIAWRSYAESMGTACTLTGAGNYTPRQDPFLYFTDIQGSASLCASTNVDYSLFAVDLAAGTYRYAWIAANLAHSGHDPSGDPAAALRASDAWLATEVPHILESPRYQAGGVIFITWDQARTGDQVPMIVISSRVTTGFKSSHAYNHASYLATVEEIFGLPRLGAAQSADDMSEFFVP
jgi:hypothetical protein